MRVPGIIRNRWPESIGLCGLTAVLAARKMPQTGFSSSETISMPQPGTIFENGPNIVDSNDYETEAGSAHLIGRDIPKIAYMSTMAELIEILMPLFSYW